MRHRLAAVLGWLPGSVAWLFVAAFVLAPLLLLGSSTIYSEHGLTLEAWRQLMATDTDWAQLLHTMALGLGATAVAALLGAGHAWLTHRTDLPGAAWLGPFGVVPLAVPPILIAMGFSDFADVTGFWPCAALLGVCYAPFVAVFTARGLRSVDGRSYEAALLCRGRGAANRLLLRLILPEIVAGCLLAFVFVVGEHGVPEFLTVKGKTWHTYAEGIFSRCTRRATGATHTDVVSPIIAALPLVAITATALGCSLALRARGTITGIFRDLPVRQLGSLRLPALLLPAAYLFCGVVVPILVMAMWAAGSTQFSTPISAASFVHSLQLAFAEAGSDIVYTAGLSALSACILIAVAVPLARQAARRSRSVDYLSVLPIAVPGILLSIGLVRLFNRPGFGEFYDSAAMLGCAYAARFLPFGVLTLSYAVQRISTDTEEAAVLTGRSAVARGAHIHLPLLGPAIWSAACLIFVLSLRELDVAVVIPAGNGTIVRRLSNVVHFGGEDMGGALALVLLVLAALPPVLSIIATGRLLRSLS